MRAIENRYRYRVMLSAAYKRAIKNEKVAENPVRATSQRKLRNNVIRWLRPEEERAIRAVIQKRVDQFTEQGMLLLAAHWEHHLCEFIVSLQSDMRKGEQYSLRSPQISFQSRKIHVQESKNGTERYIPMLPEVVRAFQTLKTLGLTRKDRAEGQPNDSPEDSCFAGSQEVVGFRTERSQGQELSVA